MAWWPIERLLNMVSAWNSRLACSCQMRACSPISHPRSWLCSLPWHACVHVCWVIGQELTVRVSHPNLLCVLFIHELYLLTKLCESWPSSPFHRTSISLWWHWLLSMNSAKYTLEAKAPLFIRLPVLSHCQAELAQELYPDTTVHDSKFPQWNGINVSFLLTLSCHSNQTLYQALKQLNTFSW